MSNSSEHTERVAIIMSPLGGAREVIDDLGWQTADDDGTMVSFHMPNHTNGSSPALIGFDMNIGMLTVSVQVFDLPLSEALRPGLFVLLNELNLMNYGATWTLDVANHEDEFDTIELSAGCHIPEGSDSKECLALVLPHLEQTLVLVLPALYQYLSQELVGGIGSDGAATNARPTVLPMDCIAMIKTCGCGRA